MQKVDNMTATEVEESRIAVSENLSNAEADLFAPLVERCLNLISDPVSPGSDP